MSTVHRAEKRPLTWRRIRSFRICVVLSWKFMILLIRLHSKTGSFHKLLCAGLASASFYRNSDTIVDKHSETTRPQRQCSCLGKWSKKCGARDEPLCLDFHPSQLAPCGGCAVQSGTCALVRLTRSSCKLGRCNTRATAPRPDRAQGPTQGDGALTQH